MEKLSSYGLLGIPDTVATIFVLVSLSLLLAPWFGGLELGPVKVPNVSGRSERVLKYGTPVLFLIAIGGFYPAWLPAEQERRSVEIPEIALRWLEFAFGQSAWDGGDAWGTITFDKTGRTARYTNAPGRVGGGIELLSGGTGGSGYVLFSGVWRQDDGKKGELDLIVSDYGDEFEVHWGPEKNIINKWTKNFEKKP